MQYIERPLLQVIANASLGAVKELWHLICRSVAMHLPEVSVSYVTVNGNFCRSVPMCQSACIKAINQIINIFWNRFLYTVNSHHRPIKRAPLNI